MDKVKFLKNLSNSYPYKGRQVFVSFEKKEDGRYHLEYVRADGSSGDIDMGEELYQEFVRRAEEEEAQG